MQIELQNATDSKDIPDLATIESWIEQAVKIIPDKIPAEQNAMTIRIINKTESAYLNSTYRHKEGATNVLAFEDHSLGELEADSLGDLAICIDIVREEAEAQNKPIMAHWAHLITHGLLHLIGYDHMEDDEAEVMEALESKILLTLGFDDPF